MAWFRGDDQIANNAKITAIVAEDLAAFGLYMLARGWTNSQPVQGYVPPHQPGALAQDKHMGPKLAEILVRHNAWHERYAECDACREHVADWPDHIGGWVIHDWWKYNAPERAGAVPGTPAQLSEKRREAGRTGGLASAAKRQQTKQTVQANQANSASKPSNLSASAASPDPVPVLPTPNGVGRSTSDVPSDASLFDAAPAAVPRPDVEELCTRLADLIEQNGSHRPTINAAWRRDARLLLDHGGPHNQPVELARALRLVDWCQHPDCWWVSRIMSMTKFRKQYDVLRKQASDEWKATRRPAMHEGGRSSTDDRIAGWQALKDDAGPGDDPASYEIPFDVIPGELIA